MNSPFPQIETEQFLLRQFTNDDLENVFLGLSDPLVIKYYGISFSTKEAAKEQMQWFSKLEEKNTGIWWAICSKNGSTFYGAGGLNNLEQENRKAEIGFWLLPQFWGKGIMSKIMPLICKFGFNNLGLHRIEGFVDSENSNCKKAMAKLNFNYEGTMVDCEVKNEKFISLDIYSILNKK